MKLTARIALAVSLPFALVLLVAAAAVVVAGTRPAEAPTARHGRLLGQVIATAAAETLVEHGERAARALIRTIDQQEPTITVRWIDLGAPPTESESSGALTPTARKKLRGGESVGRIRPEGADALHTYVPLPPQNGAGRAIQITGPLPARSPPRQMLMRIAGGMVTGLLLACVVAWALGRRMVGRPVADLLAMAREIGRGNLSRRAREARGRDELALLVREMNGMASSLERARSTTGREEAAHRRMQEQLQHADRLAIVGQLASGIAHELGTPLQSIEMRADMIRKEAGHVGGVDTYAHGIERQCARLATIARSLLRFVRKQGPRPAPQDLGEIASNTASLVATSIPCPSVEIVRRLDCATRMTNVDEDQLEQVLMNLMVNGIQSMPEGGRLIVGLEPSRERPPEEEPDARATEYTCLYVEDEGSGIPDEDLPHLFDPFFTTKDVGDGTGLGLAICHEIVKEHGGWMDVRTSPGEGSRFSVHLPTHADGRTRRRPDLEGPRS